VLRSMRGIVPIRSQACWHGSEDTVRRVYPHLGEVRHRSEVVEFRVEQHLERLGDRLQRVGLRGPFVTENVIGGEHLVETESPARPKSKRGKRLKRAGDRTRTGDVQLGKLAFYH
jgi:hypothetical protein